MHIYTVSAKKSDGQDILVWLACCNWQIQGKKFCGCALPVTARVLTFFLAAAVHIPTNQMSKHTSTSRPVVVFVCMQMSYALYT